MLTVLLILFGLYFIVLILLIRGWRRAVRTPPPATGINETVTVAIAARNEEETIGRLLDDLDRQCSGNFEVIVVDDHSSDNTSQVVRTFAERARYPLHVLNPGSLQGKKNSLSAAVAHARGSLVIVTDADCRVGEGWVASVRECFYHSSVKFVSAAVRIQQDGTLPTALLTTEFASLVGAGAATIGGGYPVMCNGANMAFRKEAFLEVNGYEGNRHIASGDDEFLMKKIHARYPEGLVFCSNPAAVVGTEAVPWKEFIPQRIRWAGKWRLHGASAGAAMALFVFSFHLSLLTVFPAALFGDNPVPSLILLAAKALLEYIFLSAVCRFLSVKWSWGAFVLLQLVYPLYAVTIGILANVGSTTWKGRKIKTQRRENAHPIGREPLNLHHVRTDT